MATSKEKNIFLDEKKVKELIKEINDRIDLIHEYFTIDNENQIVVMPYEYRVYDLTVESTAYFQNGFYSSTAESGDTYSSGLSLNHNIDEFSIFGYDYNYTDGTYYTNRLNFETGGNIRVAINNPNAKFTYNDNEVATEQDMEYLQKQLTNLEYSADGMTFTYEENSDIAYEKDVPSGASPYAVISKVGGMSYASSNLIELEDIEGTKNGITYSCKNGVIRVQGTNTSDATTFITFKFKDNKYIKLNGTYTNNWFYKKLGGDFYYARYDTYNAETQTNGIEFVSQNAPSDFIKTKEVKIELKYVTFPIATGQSIDAMVKPMLVKGSTEPAEFKPYFEGIRNSAVTEIITTKTNWVPNYEQDIIKDHYTVYRKDAWFTYNKNDTSSWANIGIINSYKDDEPLPAGTYSFRVVFDKDTQPLDIGTFAILSVTSPEERIATVSYNKNNGGYVLNNFVAEKPIVHCYLFTQASTILDDVKFKVEIVKGSFEDKTKSLPSAVKTLTDYGLGINQTYNNYIDFENKKYVRYCVPFYANGSEAITLYTQNDETGFYKFRVKIIIDNTLKASSAINSNLVQNSRMPNYTSYPDYANNKYEQIALQNNFIFIVISKDEASTVEEFKTWLANNPISGVYALNIPIEEDISELLKNVDEFIEVEELGSIRFENEYKNDVPSSVTYQVYL